MSSININTNTSTTISLFEDVTSKAHKRAEQLYREYVQSRMNEYYKVDQALVNLTLEEALGEELWRKLEDKPTNNYVWLKYQSLDFDTKDYLVAEAIKIIVKDGVLHELPLNSALAMLAIRLDKVFGISDIAIKRDLPEGDLEYKLAAIVLYISRLARIFKIEKRKAIEVAGVTRHSYDIINLTSKLDEGIIKYLKHKDPIEPTLYSKEATIEWSGHDSKFNDEQPSLVVDRLDRLQRISFKLNEGFIGKYGKEVFKTLPSYEEINKLQEILPEYIGKEFYFQYKVGPDNGRYYGNGYLIPSQAGGRNWMIQFSNERQLSEVGRRWLLAKIAEYESKDLSKLASKKLLEYYNYKDALEKADKGEAIGSMLGVDGQIMGMQSHALLLADKIQYHYCVVEDGRSHMADSLGLTKEEVKGGISPYGYGAGMNTTIKGILLAGDINTMAKLGEPEAFWRKWEELFKTYFPSTHRLRVFMKKLHKKAGKSLDHRVDYTTYAGFNATITPLQRLVTKHNTVLGRDRDFSRMEVVDGEYGSKLIAAIGHELDSSIASLFLDKWEHDIKLVHDEYCVHPNDAEEAVALYEEIARDLVKNGKDHLTVMINQMFANYVVVSGTINVDEIWVGTLVPDDIKGGIK